MPDITKRPPARRFEAERYLLVLADDVPSIGESSGIYYRHVLALTDRDEKHLVGFITLEGSSDAENVLCAFDHEGHSNYGRLRSVTTADFLSTPSKLRPMICVLADTLEGETHG